MRFSHSPQSEKIKLTYADKWGNRIIKRPYPHPGIALSVRFQRGLTQNSINRKIISSHTKTDICEPVASIKLPTVHSDGKKEKERQGDVDKRKKEKSQDEEEEGGIVSEPHPSSKVT